MKKLLSIILVCGVLFTAFPVIAFAEENTKETEIQTAKVNLIDVGEANPQETETTYRDKLVFLLEYYCWDFDYTPEYWYEIYTKESYDNYLNAKTKAEKLLADENTTETEFQNMVEEFQTAKDNLVEVGEVTQVANGTCGDNLKWTLDNNGTLSITGTGDMYFDGLAPWNYKYRIKKVEISNGVTNIYESAFESCGMLISITIPDSVTSIGRDAFNRCTRLKSINVGENNPNYSSVDGILFNKDKTELIKYPAGKTDESYTIPDSVTSIRYSAFDDCTSLTNVTIPNSVTSIGDSAFCRCTSLKSITIPDSVTSIGTSVFSTCTSLTSITIPDSVTSIGDNAFFDCESLTSITIPDSVTSIGKSTFMYCTSFTSIAIPDSVTSIGWYAFSGCTNLKSITLPEGITSIGWDTFKDCTSLTSLTIPDSVTSIGESAFENCTSLTSITIPEGVTYIDRDTFRNCTNLKNVTIPESVTIICQYAFIDCKSLTSITIPDNVTSIFIGAFSYCTSLKSITIPDNVTSIEHDAFSYCTSLESITIPNSVTSIGDVAFSYCTSLKSINVGENNPNYSSVDGILFNKDKTELITYPAGKIDKSYTIPNSVKSIAESAFSGCTNLKSITIPDSVTNIDMYAFYGCTSLSDIYYSGSKQMWNNISIDEGNDELTNANIHFGKESPKTTITLPKANASLFIGDRANINAVITNGYGATTYRSSNTKVAKVSSNGLVTAVGAGTAKITVTNNGVSKIFTVTVKKTAISLARYSANVYVKGSTVIKPTVRNGRGKTTFKSLNTKVAKVYSNGKVTALKAGTAKIRITNNKVSRIFTVKVLNPKLNKTSVAISRGKSFTLKITGRIGTAKFYTSNKKIATVNSKGKITVNKKAKKGQSAVITVKTNGVTLRCKVKVK